MVLVTRKRLYRMRWRFHRWIHVRTGAQLPRGLHHDPPKFSIQSSLESPKCWRMRPRQLPDPDLTQREAESRSTSEKSK